MNEIAVRMLNELCDKITPDKDFVVYDWEDIFSQGEDDQQKQAWASLISSGYVEIKYQDSDSVCFRLTVKGRSVNEELCVLSESKSGNNSVIKTDAAGRPVVIVKNNKELICSLKKSLKSRTTSFVWGLIGGIIGGIAGGTIVALIMHFLLK